MSNMRRKESQVSVLAHMSPKNGSPKYSELSKVASSLSYRKLESIDEISEVDQESDSLN